MRFVTDALYGDHLRGLGHPESPDRVEVVAAHLRDRGVLRESLRARDATDDELRLVHSARYVELAKRELEATTHPHYLSTGDVVVDARTLAVARRAAGGAIAAIEETARSGEPVFALVRPPGHHAERSRGMGFCVFNNAAIAARVYQQQTGRRVVLIDFDYHHGNGSEDVAGDGLSYVSTHASPAYPGTGYALQRLGDDVVVDIPLPADGVSTEAFVAAWEALMRDVVAPLRPDAIVASAGFDYVEGDPVGDLGVDVAAIVPIAAAIERVAREVCGGRVAYVLEGGYDIDALTESIAMLATRRADEGVDDARAAQAASLGESVAGLLKRAASLSRE